jgi:4-alpha-glucanotransferase
MLPIHPFYSLADLSLYQPQCIHAGNPLFISLRKLMEKKWLRGKGKPTVTGFQEGVHFRYTRLQEAYQGFLKQASATEKDAYAEFVNKHAHWLAEYALFRAFVFW